MLEKKKKAVDELSLRIPSLFRCPISLDVMKSPVSLSTGITYDRASIQRWLDAGHDTCPATMQLLPSKDLVPNHTLHRLIQIWSHHHSAAPALPSELQARLLIAEMRTSPRRYSDSASAVAANLEKLACFGAESDDNRRYLLGTDGFLDLLVDLICNADGHLPEQALKFIPALVSTEESDAQLLKELMMLSRDGVPSLLVILRSGSSEAKIAAAKVLEIIASDAGSKLLLAEKEGVIDQLMSSVEQAGTDQSLMEAVLSCLISLSMLKRVKVKLVRLGIVASIARLLTSHNHNHSQSSSISAERMLKLLEALSSCKDGRAEICEDSACVAAVLNKTMKVSKAATEHAVTVLWIVCYLFRGEKAIEAVARNNGLTKILLVMQSNCSAGVRQMAGDVLRTLRMNSNKSSSSSCLRSYDNKVTNITSLFD